MHAGAVAQVQTGGVAYLAHVGGFVFGAVTARLFEGSLPSFAGFPPSEGHHTRSEPLFHYFRLEDRQLAVSRQYRHLQTHAPLVSLLLAVPFPEQSAFRACLILGFGPGIKRRFAARRAMRIVPDERKLMCFAFLLVG